MPQILGTFLVKLFSKSLGNIVFKKSSGEKAYHRICDATVALTTPAITPVVRAVSRY